MPFMTNTTLGVLGGMGPMATVDFLKKLTIATPASCDQEHIPLVVHFCSQTPDRTDALNGVGPSPLPAMVDAALAIQRSGAQALVIPCNTAHAWYDALVQSIDIPVLHVVDAVVDQLPMELRHASIGLLATTGTLTSGIYVDRHPEIKWLLPSPQDSETWVMPAIRAIKRNDFFGASQLLERAIDSMVRQGARAIVLGCTELPLAQGEKTSLVPLIDATDALAKLAVRWARSGERSAANLLAH